MEGFQMLLIPNSYQLQPLTFHNCSKAFPREVFPWMIWWHSQVKIVLYRLHKKSTINYRVSTLFHIYKPDLYVGGHTLGFAHCSSFQNRIHNFNSLTEVDPSLQATFAASLRKVCPMHNKVNGAGATLDSTTTTFDNDYFKSLLQGTSIFSSDQALLSVPRTKALVFKFASSQAEFEDAFVKSMIKMSSIAGGGVEVRHNCRVVN